MSKLLPCPFCGGEARHYAPGLVDHHIECRKCTADVAGDSEAEAIEVWNTRVVDMREWKDFVQEVQCHNDVVLNKASKCENCAALNRAAGLWAKADKRARDLERTCEELGSVRIWQECYVWSHDLSCGHEVDTLDMEPPNYCPNCGARVVSE